MARETAPPTAAQLKASYDLLSHPDFAAPQRVTFTEHWSARGTMVLATTEAGQPQSPLLKHIHPLPQRVSAAAIIDWQGYVNHIVSYHPQHHYDSTDTTTEQEH